MFSITQHYHGKITLPLSKLEAHIEHGDGALRRSSKRARRPTLWTATVWVQRMGKKPYKMPRVVVGHSKGEMMEQLGKLDEVLR